MARRPWICSLKCGLFIFAFCVYSFLCMRGFYLCINFLLFLLHDGLVIVKVNGTSLCSGGFLIMQTKYPEICVLYLCPSLCAVLDSNMVPKISGY